MRAPVVNEVTLIDTVHDPLMEPTFAGTVPPLRDRVVEPGAAVTVPPQEFVTSAGFAITNPGWTATRLSVHAVLVRGSPFGLKTVTLRTEVSPAAMEVGVKLLLISAGKVISCA
jgi:hypothetical protein